MDLEARIHSIQKSGKKSSAPAAKKTTPSRPPSEREFYDWIEKLFHEDESGEEKRITATVDEKMTQEMDAIEEKVLEYQKYNEGVWRLDILKLLVMRQAGRTAPFLFDFLSCLLPEVKKTRPLVYLGLLLSEESLSLAYAQDTTDCILRHLAEDSACAYRWLGSTLSSFSSEILEKFLDEILRQISSPRSPSLASLSSVAVLNLYRTHSSKQFHNSFHRVVSR
jgi:hypothetical protein